MTAFVCDDEPKHRHIIPTKTMPKWRTALKTLEVATAAAIAMGMLLNVACNAPIPTKVKIMTDRSGSISEKDCEDIVDVVRLVRNQVAPSSEVELSTFGSTDTDPKIHAPSGDDGAFTNLSEWLVSNKARVSETRGVPAVRDMLDAARAADAANQRDGGHRRVCGVIAGDGGFTDLDQIPPLARELAACESFLGLWVAPVKTRAGMQAGVEKAFAPLADSGKLVVSNEMDLQSGANAFGRLLRRR